jgi:hypothetical protein
LPRLPAPVALTGGGFSFAPDNARSTERIWRPRIFRFRQGGRRQHSAKGNLAVPALSRVPALVPHR